MEELTDTLRYVAEWRAIQAKFREAIKECQTALEATPEWAKLQLYQKEERHANEQCIMWEDLAKHDAMRDFKSTGNKAPAPGVTIKVFRQLRYDSDEVLSWCKTNAPTFVRETLDRKSFDEVAHALEGAPIEIIAEPRAQLASDLSAYL